LAYGNTTFTNYAREPQVMGPVPKGVQDMVREIQNLKSNAQAFKEKKLGEGFLQWVEQFYSMERVPFSESGTDTVIPLLQYLFLIEASDLTDTIPIFYIHKEGRQSFERLKQVEKVIRNIWREEDWNLEFLSASLWSLLVGVGFVEFGLDSQADSGEGKVWGRSVNPTKIFVDPQCSTLDNAWYMMKEDTKYIDEIRILYPNHADEILKRAKKGIPEVTQFVGLEMPMGPMRSVFGADVTRMKATDGVFSLRTVWVKDSATIEYEAEEKARKADVSVRKILPNPKKILKYPNGRMIVECEGTILYDSPNPYRTFPFADIHATPPIQGFWNPPPLKFSASIQSTAQELINQLMDNCSRLNKGITYIKENTEISQEDFMGVAGEVHWIPAQAEIPVTKFPEPMPPQMTDIPFKMMELVKQYQGFNEARMGGMKAGNISSSLQDGASSSAMAITRMRSKLLGRGIQRASEIVLGIMQDYYLEPRHYLDHFGLESMAEKLPGDLYIKFDPIKDFGTLKIRLDPGSVEPMSSASLRLMVPLLRNMGLIDVDHALKWLRVPDAEEISAKLAEEAQAAAQAKEASHKKK